MIANRTSCQWPTRSSKVDNFHDIWKPICDFYINAKVGKITPSFVIDSATDGHVAQKFATAFYRLFNDLKMLDLEYLEMLKYVYCFRRFFCFWEVRQTNRWTDERTDIMHVTVKSNHPSIHSFARWQC